MPEYQTPKEMKESLEQVKHLLKIHKLVKKSDRNESAISNLKKRKNQLLNKLRGGK